MMIREISDAINFIAKQSPKRVANIVRVFSSFQLSKAIGKVNHHGMPISISVEPTTSCNLRCPECPSGLRAFSRPTGMMRKELFESIVDQLPELSYLIFYFQGEPFLHTGLLDMVRYASRKRVYTATSTNAHFLNSESARQTVESGLDRLIISIDGTTQDVYQSYRVGGKLDKVIEGTKNILSWRKKLKSRTPHVIFQFLVVKPNEHQIGEIQTLARQLGVDEVKLKTAQIYDFQNGDELIPTIDRYARYKKNEIGLYSIKSALKDECWKMWHSCVITWDGKIVPCCFDKDAHFVMGDLNKNSFEEIWRGAKYDLFRTSLFTSRSAIEMCRNCTEGAEVFA